MTFMTEQSVKSVIFAAVPGATVFMREDAPQSMMIFVSDRRMASRFPSEHARKALPALLKILGNETMVGCIDEIETQQMEQAHE